MQMSSVSGPAKPAVTPQQRTQFFIFLLIGFCLVFAISYSGRVLAKIRMDRGVVAQVEENRLAQERTAQLHARLTYVQSDAYAEEKAREEFSMAQPGDRKVVILPQPATSAEAAPAPILVAPPGPGPTIIQPQPASTAASRVDTGQPIWRQWVALFFP